MGSRGHSGLDVVCRVDHRDLMYQLVLLRGLRLNLKTQTHGSLKQYAAYRGRAFMFSAVVITQRNSTLSSPFHTDDMTRLIDKKLQHQLTIPMYDTILHH